MTTHGGRLVLVGVVIAATGLLSGCAASAKPYDNVVQLREAYISAGGDCSQWEKSDSDNTDLASSRGACNDSNVMAVFPSEAATKQQIRNTDRNLGTVFKLEWLVGPNWEITDDMPVLKKLQKTMGGTITVFGKGVTGIQTS